MLGLNKIMLIGTVGHNPETRYIDKDVSFSRFSVATTEIVSGVSGRKMESTEWHEIVVFRDVSAMVSQYVKKGDTVYVEGRLKSRYISEGAGQGHKIYEVHASNVVIISRSKANSASPMPEQQPNNIESADPEKIGSAIPGFDIENIPLGNNGGADNLPF